MCWLQGEELQLVREALRSLRDNFSGHDPQHHTLDTLEQGVSSLVDRLHSLESQHRQDRGVDTHTHAHTHSCMMNHRIFNSSFPSSRSLNLQDAEPTRQTATLGHRAQVRQAKSLFSCEFFSSAAPSHHWPLNQIVPLSSTSVCVASWAEKSEASLSCVQHDKTASAPPFFFS